MNSFFHLLKPVGAAYSERAAGGICRGGLHSCGFIKLCLRFPYFKLSSSEDMDDTVKLKAPPLRANSMNILLEPHEYTNPWSLLRWGAGRAVTNSLSLCFSIQ